MAKVQIEDGCIGCGMCVNMCPEQFKMNDEKKAEPIQEEISAENLEAVKEAAGNCPVSVIKVEE